MEVYHMNWDGSFFPPFFGKRLFFIKGFIMLYISNFDFLIKNFKIWKTSTASESHGTLQLVRYG